MSEPKFKVGDFVYCDDGWTLGCASGLIKKVERDREDWLYYIDGVRLGHGIHEQGIFKTEQEALDYVRGNFERAGEELEKMFNQLNQKELIEYERNKESLGL